MKFQIDSKPCLTTAAIEFENQEIPINLRNAKPFNVDQNAN